MTRSLHFLFSGIVFFANIISYTPSFAQAGMWTWMKGSDDFYESGVFGTKGVSNLLNTPPSLYGGVPWTDQQGNFWMFGGLGSSVYNTMWRFDPGTNEWTWIHGPSSSDGMPEYGTLGIPSPDNIPGARAYGCLYWIDSNNDLWLYGGYGLDNNGNYGVLADLWKYSIADNEWTWMAGSKNIGVSPVYGTIQQPAPANTPGSRWETTASWIDADDNLWLFGGWDSNSFPRGDLWKFDISAAQWVWMSGSTNIFTPPVWGTKGIADPSNQPGARSCYAAFKDTDGNFWMFGGVKYTLSEFLNDMWKFDPITLEWTWMSGTNVINSPGSSGAQCQDDISFAPKSRGENRATWTDDCGNLWLFGGSNYLNSFSDLWVYRIDSNDWTFVNGSLNAGEFGEYGTQGVPDPANRPGSKDGAPSWRDTLGNLWVFGGYGIYGIRNDLWKFTPDPDCPLSLCVEEVLTPTSALSSSDTAVCEKFCIGFSDLSTNDPTSWQWLFPGGTPGSSSLQQPPSVCYNDPGIFDVQLISCNAYGCDTLLMQDFITVNPTPAFPVITQTANVLTSSPAAAYQWQLNAADIPGATNQSYTATVSGFYTVIISDANGCINSASVDFLITGIADLDDYPLVSIYPNPSNGNIVIEFSNTLNSEIMIEIFNSIGQQVFVSHEKLTSFPHKSLIDIKQPPGLYFIDISNTDNWFRYKLIVN